MQATHRPHPFDPMLSFASASPALEVRLARSTGEISDAQRLRYRVFMEEGGATPNVESRRSHRESDEFDQVMDHLVVIDHRRSTRLGQVVGTYRLLRQTGPADRTDFYSAGEFDLSPLLGSGLRLLELGRSCVLRDYRGGAVIQKLWRAIAGYVAEHRIELMFGCASLPGTDPARVAEQLAYLHYQHLAPAHLRPSAQGRMRVSLDAMAVGKIDITRAYRSLEPLLKGYLRAGAYVGEGAYVDPAFNCIDVCIVLPTLQMSQRHRRNFERKLQRPLAVERCPTSA